MAITDRRSGQERRTVERQPVSLDVEWEGAEGRFSGTLSDLSEGGCFVLSSGQVAEGESVKIFLPLGEGMKVEVVGEVRNFVFEMGFALRFLRVSEAQTNVIQGLMAKHGEYL